MEALRAQVKVGIGAGVSEVSTTTLGPCVRRVFSPVFLWSRAVALLSLGVGGYKSSLRSR